MESLLSLPRSAKAGLTVLLAVALLGWAIVAYSAKRQHDDARSLRNAVATIRGQEEQTQTTLADIQRLEERLAATEAELSASREAALASQQEKSDVEAALAELEAELEEAKVGAVAESGNAEDGDRALGLIGDGQDEPGDASEADPVRARLTKLMTKLSAESATLRQRERDLARLKEDKQAAEAEIEALEGEAARGEAARGRLTDLMTTLSARTATLQQRERELAQARSAAEEAFAEIEALEGAIEERDALRSRLTETMARLSAERATLQQRERELARLREDMAVAETEIEALQVETARGEAAHGRLTGLMTTLSARTATLQQKERELEQLRADYRSAGEALAALEAEHAEIDSTATTLADLRDRQADAEQALDLGAEALAANKQAIGETEARLQALAEEQGALEALIAEKQAALTEKEEEFQAIVHAIVDEQAKLDNLQAQIVEAEQELASLEAAIAEAEAESSGLTAEIDALEAGLSDKQDALAYVGSDLERLNAELETSRRRLEASEASLKERQDQLEARQNEVKTVEASLASLKAHQPAVEKAAAELKATVSDREAALGELEAIKGELEATRTELNYQNTILNERQEQIALADKRLDQVQLAIRKGDESSDAEASGGLPIPAVNLDDFTALSIDPLHEPFPIQTPAGIRLTQIHFDLGSAELTPGGLRKAKEAANWIKAQNVEKVRLIGFTDTIGTKENNKRLAARRADSLLELFATEGIDPSKVEIIANGEEGAREVIPDQTSEPLNRCVGIFVGASG